MDKKRKIMLVIYAFVIAILLILIMFIVPDSVFLEKYKDLELPQIVPQEFTDLEIQKNNLLNNNYSYEFDILDSMGSKSYMFSCSGSIIKTNETGSCTLPERVSYTELDKKKVFKVINENYISPEYLFNLIKDVEPKEIKDSTTRKLTYNIMIKNLETELTISTNLESITEILLNNAYMTYHMRYSNIEY